MYCLYLCHIEVLLKIHTKRYGEIFYCLVLIVSKQKFHWFKYGIFQDIHVLSFSFLWINLTVKYVTFEYIIEKTTKTANVLKSHKHYIRNSLNPLKYHHVCFGGSRHLSLYEMCLNEKNINIIFYVDIFISIYDLFHFIMLIHSFWIFNHILHRIDDWKFLRYLNSKVQN